jgi:very-short-patch-repair endonuclease
MRFIEQIKVHYEERTPEIFKNSEIALCKWSDPYNKYISWRAVFSPIESTTWEAIRIFGKAPMYPQYPVGKYFVDFGNPVVKVAIECDGKEYHTDKEKDFQRDKELFLLGWKVYRISGSDCCNPVDGYFWRREVGMESYKMLEEFYMKTVEGLLTALAVAYFGYKDLPRGDRHYVKKCLDERISVTKKKIAV